MGAFSVLSLPLIVQVPSPAAYIFQKGLSFTRRRDKQKAPKDLYYIFDILAGLPGIQDKMLAYFLKLFQKSMPSGSGNSCQISERILKAPPPKAPCA
jgi:hypothetical protein